MTDLGPQWARIGLGPSDGSSDKTKKAHMGRTNFSQGRYRKLVRSSVAGARTLPMAKR